MHGGSERSVICEVCGEVRFGNRPKKESCYRCWEIYFRQRGNRDMELAMRLLADQQARLKALEKAAAPPPPAAKAKPKAKRKSVSK